VLVVEGRLSKSTIMELERRGHKIELGPDWSKAASLPGRAAANARGMQGYAIGR
jgi:gamma-glutamyltranspeptidase / glutathione hydrolase